LETLGGNPKLKIGSIEQLQSLLQELDLCDIWRIRNPDSKRFTWSGYAQGTASNCNNRLHRRLDFFYISDSLQPLVQYTDIIPAPATDHSAITLSLKSLPKSTHGPSFWKINNSLLQDSKYVQMIQELIGNNKKYFKENNITNPHLRWELIKYEIRKSSTSFAKAKAKNSREYYRDIETKIRKIEQIKDSESNETLSKKYELLKLELNQRSDYITKGIIMS